MTGAEPEILTELVATLRALAPYALDAARRSERLGLAEEAAAARALHARAQWAIRAAGGNPTAPASGIGGWQEPED